MPTQPPTRTPPPPAAPARPPVPPPPQRAAYNTPPNRPQGATVGPAQTYPPGSPYQARMERDNDGPDPQEAKLRPYELAATIADEEVVETVAQEQRERSAEYEERGVEVVKAENDERDPADRPRTVPGVSPTQVDADAPMRSTPEARAAQNRAAP